MTQISLFDGDTPLKITKPIRLIELFAGYGSQSLALKYLKVPFEHWKICEWAVKSIQAYKDLHFGDDTCDYSKAYSVDELIDMLLAKGISADYNAPMTREQIKRMGEQKIRTVYNNIIATNNLVSVCNAHAQDFEIQDTEKYTYILTYSFPCFTADSLVLTDKGYKPINEIEIGDMVLTCDNTYQMVTKTFDNGIKPILKINAMAVDEIKCTNNHRFYVRTMSRVGHNQHRVFSNPYWKPACTLTKKDYLGVAINQKSIIPTWNGVDFDWSDGRKTRHKNQLQCLLGYTDFWWLIGRYMGDGTMPVGPEVPAGFANGDGRMALNMLEQAAAMVDDGAEINIELLESILGDKLQSYDKKGDNHYDTVSAFIKSMRGSDPDAAIHYLARMLAGGEDVNFIARRVAICAAEDVGNADPMALVVAMAAVQAVQFVGMPEARIPLAEAVTYIASAPKSNAAYMAIDSALGDVRHRNCGSVPVHLRDAHYKGAAKLGHGIDYIYPHDFPGHFKEQQYLPQEMQGVRYYQPSENGREARQREYLQSCWGKRYQ